MKAKIRQQAARAKQHITLTLPFPDSRLLPNRKAHWATKAKATAEARTTAWGIGIDYRFNQTPIPETMKRCTAKVTFYPPDKRRRDLDNLLRAMKPFWDGLVDAQLIEDDSCISEISVRLEQPGDPKTVIELEELTC